MTPDPGLVARHSVPVRGTPVGMRARVDARSCGCAFVWMRVCVDARLCGTACETYVAVMPRVASRTFGCVDKDSMNSLSGWIGRE